MNNTIKNICRLLLGAPLIGLGSLLLILCFVSCVKVIDVDTRNQERKIVVMSNVKAGEKIMLRITWSRFFLDSSPFKVIDNAQIELKVNGATPNYTTTYDSGYYHLGFTPQPGEHLQLKVTVPGHEPVTAETVVPSVPDVTNINATTDSTHNYFISFDLKDNAGEQNFYGVKFDITNTIAIKYKIKGDDRDADEIISDTIVQNYSYKISCNDLMLTNTTSTNELFGDSPDESYIFNFNDNNINGTTHRVKLNAQNAMTTDRGIPYYVEIISLDTLTKKAELEISSYSRDRYMFIVTEGAYDHNEITSLFNEPVQIHNNINGGIGVFAATTSKKYILNAN